MIVSDADRAMCTGLLLCASVRFAGAQPAKSDSALAAKPARPVWQAGLNSTSSYESNVRFGAAAAVGDVYHRVAGTITGGVADAITRAEIDVRGEVVRFNALRDLDRRTYDVGALLSRRWSPRVSTRLGARALTSMIPGATQRLDLGLLPLTLSRTQSAFASLTARVTPRVDFASGVDASRLRFDDSTYVGGYAAGATASVQTRASPRGARGLIAEVRAAVFDRVTLATMTLETDMRQNVGWLSIQVRAGGTGVKSDVAQVQLLPSGSLELLRVRNTSSVSIRAAHSVAAAFGLGRTLESDQLAVAAQHVFGRRTARMSADLARSVDPRDINVRVTSAGITTEFRQPIAGGLSLALSGFARRRVEASRVPDINNAGVSLSASYEGKR